MFAKTHDSQSGFAAPAKNEIPVVDLLQAKMPDGSLRCALIFELSKPNGFWTLVHPACNRAGVLTSVSHRAARAEGGAA